MLFYASYIACCIPWVYLPVECFESSHGWVKRARAEGASYLRQQEQTLALHTRAPILQRYASLSNSQELPTALQLCVDASLKPKRLHRHTHTHTDLHLHRAADLRQVQFGCWTPEPRPRDARPSLDINDRSKCVWLQCAEPEAAWEMNAAAKHQPDLLERPASLLVPTWVRNPAPPTQLMCSVIA